MQKSRIRKPLSVLLSILMVLSVFGGMTFTAYAVEVICPYCDNPDIEDIGSGNWFCPDCKNTFPVNDNVTCPYCGSPCVEEWGDDWNCYHCASAFSTNGDVICPACGSDDLEDYGDGNWYCNSCDNVFYFMSPSTPVGGDTITYDLNPDNASINWDDRCGTDHYWVVSANTGGAVIHLSVFSPEQAAGTYGWEEMDQGGCYVYYPDVDTSAIFTDGSCTVEIEDGIVTVIGSFTSEDGNTYEITITTSVSVPHTPVPVTFDLGGRGENVTVDVETGTAAWDAAYQAFSGLPTTDGFLFVTFSRTPVEGEPTAEQIIALREAFDGETITGPVTYYVVWVEEASFAATVTLGDNTFATLGSGSDYPVTVTFTPAADGWYQFTSTNEQGYDPVAEVDGERYDNELEDGNFTFKRELTANEPFSFTVWVYTGSSNYTVSLRVAETEPPVMVPVTFDLGGRGDNVTVEVEKGAYMWEAVSKAFPSSQPVVDGWRLIAFSRTPIEGELTAEQLSAETEAVSNATVEEAVTCYAVWVEDVPVNVTFDMQGHGENVTVTVSKGSYFYEAVNQAFTSGPPTASGATYVGFSLSPLADNPTNEALNAAQNALNYYYVIEQVTIFVVWKTADVPAEVPVVFDLQGKGSNVFVSVPSGAFLTEAISQAFPLGDPTAENAEVAGYSLSPMADNPTEEELAATMDAVNSYCVTEPVTVFVVWKTADAPAEVPVMFDLQGKGSNLIVNVAPGTFLMNAINRAFPYDPPAVPNAVYVGYSLSPMADDPPEEALAAAMDEVNLSTVQAPTTVYVVWKTAETVPVTIDLQGRGDNVTTYVASGDYLVNAVSRVFPSGPPSAENAECACFSLSAMEDDPTQEQIDNASTELYCVVTEPVTVYVVWKTAAPEYNWVAIPTSPEGLPDGAYYIDWEALLGLSEGAELTEEEAARLEMYKAGTYFWDKDVPVLKGSAVLTVNGVSETHSFFETEAGWVLRCGLSQVGMNWVAVKKDTANLEHLDYYLDIDAYADAYIAELAASQGTTFSEEEKAAIRQQCTENLADYDFYVNTAQSDLLKLKQVWNGTTSVEPLNSLVEHYPVESFENFFSTAIKQYLDPDHVAADAVIEKIDAIGEVTYTDECKAKIDEARDAYDALTEAQQGYVDNYTVLTDAEETYAALRAAALPEALTVAGVSRTPFSFYYNGEQQQPTTVTVTNSRGEVLTEGVDYTVTYPESVEPGFYLVRVTGIGNYTGTIRKGYTIKDEVASFTVSRAPTTLIADGEQQQPAVTVTNTAGEVLTEGVDYMVTYPDSAAPGSYMLRVDGLGAYAGLLVRKAYIVKEALTVSGVSRTPVYFTANGEQQQPTVTVTNAAGEVLTEDEDYTVTYPESVDPGTYLLRVTGKGYYTGTIFKAYVIR